MKSLIKNIARRIPAISRLLAQRDALLKEVAALRTALQAAQPSDTQTPPASAPQAQTDPAEPLDAYKPRLFARERIPFRKGR